MGKHFVIFYQICRTLVKRLLVSYFILALFTVTVVWNFNIFFSKCLLITKFSKWFIITLLKCLKWGSCYFLGDLHILKDLQNSQENTYQKQSPWGVLSKMFLNFFAKFAGKHLSQSLFLNLSLRPATLLKIRLRHWWFPVNLAKFLRTPFFYIAPSMAAFCLQRNFF